MRRFDERQTLDHLAEAGAIDAALADALGRVVAAAHADAAPADAKRWIAAIGVYSDEHAAAFGQRPDLFPPDEIRTLADASRATFARIQPLLAERGRKGFIRRIHGDLHLGNIVLLDAQPVLFDAIEFSDVIASGDVLYDLAFLLMDLVERGLGPAANIVLNRYLAESRRDENLDALAALPFFLATRAAIRAMVTAARLERAGVDERPEIARGAPIRLGEAFHRAGAAGHGGGRRLSGTGKSVLARALAPTPAPPPGAVCCARRDAQGLFGRNELEQLPPTPTPEVTARVYATIIAKARRVVAAGHTAVLDAVFARPDERRQAERAAAEISVPFQGLFLDADVATRVQRAGARERDASDADAAIARAQELRSRRPRLASRRCVGDAGRDYAAGQGGAGMSEPAAAQSTRWRAALRRCPRRLLLLSQSLFAAGAAARIVARVRRRGRADQHHHDRADPGARHRGAVRRRHRRRARAKMGHHVRHAGRQSSLRGHQLARRSHDVHCDQLVLQQGAPSLPEGAHRRRGRKRKSAREFRCGTRSTGI
jgi:predicted kinase